MDFTDFIAGKDDDGRRLDRILQKILPKNSNSGIYSAIRKKLIRINGQGCKGNQTVCQGDSIQVASFLINPQQNPQDNYSKDKIISNPVKPLDESDIVFMNGHILIVNKKSGISVQPGGKGESLWEKVVKFYREKLAQAQFHLNRDHFTGLTGSQAVLLHSHSVLRVQNGLQMQCKPIRLRRIILESRRDN